MDRSLEAEVRATPIWKITLAVALVLAAFAAAGFYVQRQDKPELPRFTVAAVERGDIVQAVATTGQLTPLVTVEVSSQISGLVVAVEVDFNEPVKKGQVLARIDPATYEQSLRRAEADQAAAQAAHALNATNVRRLEGLLAEELVSQQDYDQALALWRQSQAGLLTRRAAVENARVDLERCIIKSPIDGIVIFKQVEVGRTIAASFNAPTLFVIAPDLARMRIIAPINEVDVWSVRVGQPVTFTVDALPEREFHGRLTQIRNPYTPTERQQQAAAQPQNGITTFDGVIEVDNSDLVLRPSLTANVSIVVARRPNVLRIPNGALRVELPPALAARVAAEGNTRGFSHETGPNPRGDRGGSVRKGGESRDGGSGGFGHETGPNSGRGGVVPEVDANRDVGPGGFGPKTGPNSGADGGGSVPEAGDNRDVDPSGFGLKTGPNSGAEGRGLGPETPGEAASLATVYRLPDGAREALPQPVTVRLGISDSLMTEILGGLKEGDRVITGTASEWEQRKGRLFE